VEFGLLTKSPRDTVLEMRAVLPLILWLIYGWLSDCSYVPGPGT